MYGFILGEGGEGEGGEREMFVNDGRIFEVLRYV